MSDKWSGAVTRIVDAPAAKLWDLASDFCGLCRWMPLVDECRRVIRDGDEDGDRDLGCVRLVIGTSLPRRDGAKSWITEKLVAMDPASRTFTYVLQDGNIEVLSGGYTATFSVSEAGQDPEKSLVEWKFEIQSQGSSTLKQEEVVESLGAVLSRNIDFLVFAAQRDLKSRS